MNTIYEALPSNLLCHQLDIYQLIRDNFLFIFYYGFKKNRKDAKIFIINQYINYDLRTFFLEGKNHI